METFQQKVEDKLYRQELAMRRKRSRAFRDSPRMHCLAPVDDQLVLNMIGCCGREREHQLQLIDSQKHMLAGR